MTPEQINIAIAESIGLCPHIEIEKYQCQSDWGFVCKKCRNDPHRSFRLKDYCNDLNAMHEVEKTLTPEQEEDYVDRLGAAIMQTAYEDDKRWMESNLSSFDSTYRATANQRAESYLRTIGKWKK